MQLPKHNHGEHFADLEMLTTLLPRKKKDLKSLGKKPLIEVLEQGGACGEGVGPVGGAEEEEEEFDWQVEQTLPSAEKVHALQCPVRVRTGLHLQVSELMSGLVPYGFALQHQGVFLKLQVLSHIAIHTSPHAHHLSFRRRSPA